MTMATEVQTTQVYNIVIKATPEAVWEAITKPEFTERYFYEPPDSLPGPELRRSFHDSKRERPTDLLSRRSAAEASSLRCSARVRLVSGLGGGPVFTEAFPIISTRDLPRLIAFYGDAVGFVQTYQFPR